MKLKWIGAYELNKSNIDGYVPNVAGIYRISVKQNDDSLKVVYVGQTEDLVDRMSQYLNKDTDNDCLLNHLNKHYCYFKVAEVVYQRDRDAGEKALFEHFGPNLCNDPDKIPNVEPADINFEN